MRRTRGRPSWRTCCSEGSSARLALSPGRPCEGGNRLCRSADVLNGRGWRLAKRGIIIRSMHGWPVDCAGRVFHPDLQFLAESGRTVLRADHRQPHSRGSLASVKHLAHVMNGAEVTNQTSSNVIAHVAHRSLRTVRASVL